MNAAKLLLITLMSTLLFSSCKQNTSQIPYVLVDLTLNVNNPSYSDISNINGWMYLTGGSEGLIIYRSDLMGFMVYDRHSTYLPETRCQVYINENTFIIEDPCSESTYSIIDGSVSNGPASMPLKRYNTSFDGNILRIFN